MELGPVVQEAADETRDQATESAIMVRNDLSADCRQPRIASSTTAVHRNQLAAGNALTYPTLPTMAVVLFNRCSGQ